jgi:hypothetical protein|tara:strand:- start:2197 stop:2484 length:288 start_codon:yes stop_codon:yes gene_type:complete
MRKIYSLELLRKVHLSRYIYLNEEYQEVYAWFGGNEIKIFDYVGDEIGHCNIVKTDGSEYTITDVVNERDVHVSIDGIVNTCFTETIEEATKDES